MNGPGPLIAAGRDADIFDYGNGLVLRRSRQGRSMAHEAKLMEYVRSHGYPVPAVDHLSDDGTDMIMQRVDGPSIVEAVGRKPWTLRSSGAVLGELHRRLHRIPAPDWLAAVPGSEGSALLHLDLHPLNVILGPEGPMVIDWPNAARGQGEIDVALAWVLMAAGEIPGSKLKATVLGRARGLLIGGFLHGFDLAPIRALLSEVVERKCLDPHMSEAEQRRMREMARREGSPRL